MALRNMVNGQAEELKDSEITGFKLMSDQLSLIDEKVNRSARVTTELVN